MNCSNFFDKIDKLNSQYVGVWEDICNIESRYNKASPYRVFTAVRGIYHLLCSSLKASNKKVVANRTPHIKAFFSETQPSS